jgi:hypothetical protein
LVLIVGEWEEDGERVEEEQEGELWIVWLDASWGVLWGVRKSEYIGGECQEHRRVDLQPMAQKDGPWAGERVFVYVDDGQVIFW